QRQLFVTRLGRNAWLLLPQGAEQLRPPIEANISQQPLLTVDGYGKTRTLRNRPSSRKRKAESCRSDHPNRCTVRPAKREPIRHAPQQRLVYWRAACVYERRETAHRVSGFAGRNSDSNAI